MRKLYIPVIAAFIIAAGYIMSGAQSKPGGQHLFLGDADALGTDDDAEARAKYEWTLLHDPATGRIPDHIRAKELAFAATLPNDGNLAYAKSTATSYLAWQQRGPWNVGGRTRALGIDVNNENILLAGSCSGGMWRSADKGASWAPVNPSTQLKSVSGLAQDTRVGHTNTWYYITGEAYGASASGNGAYYQGNGVYKSTDNGVTWTVLPTTVGTSSSSFTTWSEVTWNIATSPADTAAVVYVASYGGIWRTADGGATWNLVLGSFGGSDSYFTDVAVSKTGVVYATISSYANGVYAGSHAGIYRSTDGITFANITPAGFPVKYNRVKIGISPMDENQVYFIGNTPDAGMPDTNFVGTVEWNSLWKYRYVSGDGSGTGGAWQDRSANLPSAGGMFDKFTCQGSYDLVVKVKPNDTNVVFLGGTNLYRSTNGFADNTQTTFLGGYEEGGSLPVINGYLNHHPDQHELLFFPSNPNHMLSSNDGGVFYTNDNTVPGILWTSLNNGYLTSMFYTCAIDHASTSDIVIGGAQDNGSWFTNSTNLHTPWVTPRGGDGSFCAIADNSAAYYFSIQSGKIMRGKLDNSGNVDSFARIDPIGGRGYMFINPFTLDPNNNNIMYMAGGKFLWRNNNLAGIPYARNWDTISTNWVKFADSSMTNIYDTTITAVAVSKIPANRVYYGTNYKRLFRIDSANIGTHKAREITNNTLFPTGTVSSIAVDPRNADNVMVTFSNYNVYSIFYTTDGGTTWVRAAGNLYAANAPSIRWATIIPVSDGTVYMVGTSVGLFATSLLNGNSTVWVQQGTNSIGNAVVDMIDYRSTDGLVVIATHANGIYSSHITKVSDVNGVKDIARADPGFNFTNYPNPFSNQTTIRFDLKERAHVNLIVMDEMGRTVKTLADEVMDAGEQRYPFQPGNLPSGIYYCTLRAGSFSETRRILKQ